MHLNANARRKVLEFENFPATLYFFPLFCFYFFCFSFSLSRKCECETSSRERLESERSQTFPSSLRQASEVESGKKTSALNSDHDDVTFVREAERKRLVLR